MKRIILPFLALPLLTACSITGLGSASGQYSCGAPAGVTCMRMTDVYASTLNTPSPATAVAGSEAKPSSTKTTSSTETQPLRPQAGAGVPAIDMPLRSGPRVVRMWVAPYEDSDGDLVDESRLYVQVDGGRWLIEHQRHAIASAYAPLKPPASALESGSKADDATAAAVSSTAKTVNNVSSNFWQKVMPNIGSAPAGAGGLGSMLPNMPGLPAMPNAGGNDGR